MHPIDQDFQLGGMFDLEGDEKASYLDMFLQFLDGTLTPKGMEATSDEPTGEIPQFEPSPDEKDNPFN